jgi:two-component system sensor kinase FixL
MEEAPRRELVVSTAPAEGDMVEVAVADTGPGIDPGMAQQLFQPFVTTKAHGMGVGLSISRTIVEAHGGVIWAENIRPTEADATSEPLGARFVVGLPI